MICWKSKKAEVSLIYNYTFFYLAVLLHEYPALDHVDHIDYLTMASTGSSNLFALLFSPSFSLLLYFH